MTLEDAVIIILIIALAYMLMPACRRQEMSSTGLASSRPASSRPASTRPASTRRPAVTDSEFPTRYSFCKPIVDKKDTNQNDFAAKIASVEYLSSTY